MSFVVCCLLFVVPFFNVFYPIFKQLLSRALVSEGVDMMGDGTITIEKLDRMDFGFCKIQIKEYFYGKDVYQPIGIEMRAKCVVRFYYLGRSRSRRPKSRPWRIWWEYCQRYARSHQHWRRIGRSIDQLNYQTTISHTIWSEHEQPIATIGVGFRSIFSFLQ